eukprot:TRINITY_DN4190_c0_g1_i2.p1 TRINITY_DN4190_c0_g1~~TRINITY_DN4190_c0_g1_i2.p1  ORF type:complete len:143 (+),score=38.67 TRINITY_DN4190_c0_g1_i2:81-509(+)
MCIRDRYQRRVHGDCFFTMLIRSFRGFLKFPSTFTHRPFSSIDNFPEHVPGPDFRYFEAQAPTLNHEKIKKLESMLTKHQIKRINILIEAFFDLDLTEKKMFLEKFKTIIPEQKEVTPSITLSKQLTQGPPLGLISDRGPEI